MWNNGINRGHVIGALGSLLIGIMAYPTYRFFSPLPMPLPIVFLGGALDPDEVTSPQAVKIKRSVRWNANCQRVLNEREIIDSERQVHKLEPDYISPPELAALPEDHIINSDKFMMIPSGLPKGSARYRVMTCLSCAALSSDPICIPAPELKFTVR